MAHSSTAARALKPKVFGQRQAWIGASLLLAAALVAAPRAEAAALEPTAAGPGGARAMSEAELSEVSGQGLEPLALLAMTQQSGTLQGKSPEVLNDLLRHVQDGSLSERQTAKLYEFAATTGVQGSLNAVALNNTLASLSAASLALPVLLPVIGFPLFGLLPMLPQLPHKKSG